MDEKLTLNDGTELTGHMVETDSRLFVYLYGITMTEAFELLNDPEKTKVIKGEQYGVKQTIRGYKHLCSVSEEMGGQMINGSLKKG